MSEPSGQTGVRRREFLKILGVGTNLLVRDEGVRGVSANGVLGDPTGASAAEGERVLKEMVADVVGRLT